MTDHAEGPTGVGVRRILARWNLELRRIRSPILRYGFAVVSFAIAFGLAVTLEYYQYRGVELPVLTLSIALTAWYAGAGPSVLAIVLSVACFDYYFLEPIYSIDFYARDVPYFLVFVTWGVVVAWFSTVRRRIEDSLRQARDRLQIEVEQRTQQTRLLDQTHDSIFIRKVDSVITYWNRGARELYGWRAEDAIGKCSHELLRTIFPAPLDELVEELLRTGRWEGELKHIKADGTEVTVASRWSLHRDDQEQPIAIMETNNDITERKRREDEIRGLNQELAKRAAELEAANRELESFAYSVSHDLRAPLRHIAGYAELLQKHSVSSPDDKSQRYMKMILDSAKRMGTLIDDLLGFSRIGRAETRKTAVNLAQLVREVVGELGQETRGRDIAWKIGALPVCYGDRSMLKVVFVNLASNAVKFTRIRKRAEIEIGCAGGEENQVEVFVRDNGAGFDMQYANKLFGVFQRLHLSEEFEGTGIGLATAQRIIHRHGGKIRAEGAVDRGATFYFSLPKAYD
jgi:PAS domain S-box-containing protein